ncbi:YlbL family protein [Planctomonas psychrotolerans]|uniref:YlbL family protein n=1 Tax=Planctomonas psychrotolerans TaxID=2528712 RepID=UPI001238D776|nr:S16 family serine protease [Planctomonas psychrotolerans]
MSSFAPYPADGALSRRGKLGWALILVSFVLILILSAVPSPYVIEQPGPVYDTLGSNEAVGGGEPRPLIDIPDARTYDSTGELNLLTVSVVGNPENLPHWLDVATAWFTPSKAVVPVESVYPPNVSTEDRNQENRILMVNSQRDAVAAALTELGYEVPRTLSVESVIDGSPATGVLEEGDSITTVGGDPVVDLAHLRERIAANGASAPLEFGLLRQGTAMTLSVTPEERNGTPAIGVLIATEYTFPFDVEIELDDVGGPSAGMMFALGIMEKLTPEQLTGGEVIAGTGTIDAQGTVGPIGGIRQKLFGAERAGADFFLAPSANCDEVVGNVPDGLEVFAVATLDDALAALGAIAADSGYSGLPRCTAPSQN